MRPYALLGKEGSQKMSEQSLGEANPHQGKCHGNDETERLKQILTSWGMLVSDFRVMRRRERLVNSSLSTSN